MSRVAGTGERLDSTNDEEGEDEDEPPDLETSRRKGVDPVRSFDYDREGVKRLYFPSGRIRSGISSIVRPPTSKLSPGDSTETLHFNYDNRTSRRPFLSNHLK